MSLGVVAGIVAACALMRHVHVATVVLVLLLSILTFASRWGLLEAALSTCMGAALLDYFFLPPAGFGISTLEYWLVLVTFLGVGLLASYFAARTKRQADEAALRQLALERLHAFCKTLRTESSHGSIAAASLDSLARIFEVEAAAFYDRGTGEVTRSGPKAGAISTDLLRHAIGGSELLRERSTGTLCVPLCSGGHAVGSLALCDRGMSELTFRAIADRIEAGLEEVQAQGEARRAEETRRNQELKTALLDSLVHEIKTPLSVIKTAVSSLLSRDSDVVSRRELLSIINEETDRMDASISEVFWTARVEAGSLQSGKGPHDISSMVDETLNELKPHLGSRSIRVEVPDSLPQATCDVHMIKGVLKELLNNALKYSPSGSPLTISVRQAGDEIVTSVSDSGAGIQPGEEQRIFERHYRGSVRAQGSGLGLALAKTIVEAHGGRIGVTSQPGTGSVFHFSLPVSHREAA